MDIIKVDAIGSTNTFLKEINRDHAITIPTCVIANEQFAGKGQRGAVWQSNAGENLTCSVFMPISTVGVLDQFQISMAVSLAVYDTFIAWMLPKLSIKWPNDILSDKYKVCGILIENIVNNGRVKGAIIGIGINVNQLVFEHLPLAISMKKLLGEHLEIEEVLEVLLTKLEGRFSNLYAVNFKMIQKNYETLLFRKNKPSTFLDAKGISFIGIIQGVTTSGKLQVLLEDEVIRNFDLKELKLLY